MQDPEPTSASLDRRTFLAVCAGAPAATGGCVLFDSEAGPGIPTATGHGELPSTATDWPTSQFDARNTGYNPAVAASPGDRARLQWRHAVPTADPDVAGTELAGGASSAGGRIYVSTTEGRLIALSWRTGAREWQAGLRGAGQATPTVTDDRVFVGTEGFLEAFDRSTGRRAWTTPLAARWDEPPAFDVEVRSAPTVGDGRVFAGTNDGRLYAFDAETGEVLWTGTAARPDPARTPGGANLPVFGGTAVADGTVYAGNRNGRLYAFDGATGERRWTLRAGADVTNAPTVVDGTVYAVSEVEVLAVDAAAGTIQWTYREDPGSAATSPAVVDGTLYLAAGPAYESLSVVALDAGDRSVKWRRPGRPQASPSASDDTVYVGLHGGLAAIDAETGEIDWRLRTAGVLDDAPVVADGAVVAADRDGYVYGIGAP